MSTAIIQAYLQDKEEKWHESFIKLYHTIKENIPDGFTLEMQYGMPSFVVPLTTFPEGYHVEEGTPLPFISIAVQKKHIAVYHMGIYAKKELLNWFQREYPHHMTTKLNMGKSCIRFTNPKNIPFKLLGELSAKITVDEWIQMYRHRTE
ncbi:DUF1801 domain-containing protein [Gracilibacillus sp. HCP3S3_G5_1]|uniref:DUF1801 domain-containing protein n=1 Tax=unclassified Gracilibacillus TaxID=2625209 RepID=UPI003F8AA2CF